MIFGDKDKKFCGLWNTYHKKQITCVCIGKMLMSSTTEVSTIFNTNNICLSGSQDGKCKIWDVRTGKCLRTLQVNRGKKPVTSICYIPVAHDDTTITNNNRCLTTSGHCIHIWNFQTGKCLKLIRGNVLLKNYHTSDITSSSITHDNLKCITVANTECKIWDIEKGDCLYTWQGKKIFIFIKRIFLESLFFLFLFLFLN